MTFIRFRTIRKFCSILMGVIAILLLLLVIRMGYYYFSDNVHTVIHGQIYRSAQWNESGLSRYTKQFQLKTIINLRGAWPGNGWYQVESRFAASHHLHYYPIQFSAYSLPTKERLRELVQLLETAPKPLVFHCEGGADRTGMAAAISVILFDKHPTLDEIRRQASWHYNAISPKTVGYQVMRNYFAWLKAHHETSSKQHFLTWLNSPEKMKPYHGWFLV